MAYTDSSTWRDRPAAIAGVVLVHGALAYGLLAGLSYTGIITRDEPLPSSYFPTTPPPEPTPPEAKAEPREAAAPLPYQPPRAVELDTRTPRIDSSTIILPPLPEVVPDPGSGTLPSPGPSETVMPQPSPSVTASTPPRAARPRNAALGWVTQDDYRASWINRELTGSVGFVLEIDANGRVASCRVTRPSGHSELDQATCALISRRARFEPARDSSGAAVMGSYSGTVTWTLPN
ncbi:energy transducer TonB [Qipengyuania sp. YIM B01966]|uniref:energy transducer TonB n=1 Tax=Qipengyuania sp. YIM B01966 TaxID=2778646 RepID=UPI001F369501|nr:energy transducer TonB [Qipengyuania sp. YIM B01966]